MAHGLPAPCRGRGGACRSPNHVGQSSPKKGIEASSSRSKLSRPLELFLRRLPASWRSSAGIGGTSRDGIQWHQQSLG
eukprot:2938388-Amphidinium_carterae.1